jgi:hypothetical protein
VLGWIKGINMKKIFIYIITILAILHLMACEQTSQPVTPSPPQTTTPQTPNNETSALETVEVLNPPRNVTLSIDSNNILEIKWDQVPGASSYVVIFDKQYEVTQSSSPLILEPSEFVYNVFISNATDVRIVSIDNAGNRSISSENAILNESLLAPIIQVVSGRFNFIEWSQVQNATHYSITIGDERIYMNSTGIRLSDLNLSPGLKNFEVVAHVLGLSSSPAATLTAFYGFEISLPELPLRVCTSCDSSSSSKTYEITLINYKFIEGQFIEFFFTGRLIESASGPDTAVSERIAFRIFDDEDFTIASNTFSTSSLFPGEGFRNQNAFWFSNQTGSPYGKYRLEIISIQN